MVFAVGHFAFDADPTKQKILRKHIFNIRIYLPYAVYILFHTSFANTPFTNAGAPSLL